MLSRTIRYCFFCLLALVWPLSLSSHAKDPAKEATELFGTTFLDTINDAHVRAAFNLQSSKIAKTAEDAIKRSIPRKGWLRFSLGYLVELRVYRGNGNDVLIGKNFVKYHGLGLTVEDAYLNSIQRSSIDVLPPSTIFNEEASFFVFIKLEGSKFRAYETFYPFTKAIRDSAQILVPDPKMNEVPMVQFPPMQPPPPVQAPPKPARDGGDGRVDRAQERDRAGRPTRADPPEHRDPPARRDPPSRSDPIDLGRRM
jgi:hypothetical protein